ncbi:hypothetical protein HYC85_019841 [Camellia sinensis]|uniref:Acyl-[acyl-carrier-protein] desaturase n=1 Tax=Camellia sinensis TaxID=4442 RepID=A0A7J7GN51_CAMSI|nr:hypothetical protein HYC85_019841 [Camellia sinensis]
MASSLSSNALSTTLTTRHKLTTTTNPPPFLSKNTSKTNAAITTTPSITQPGRLKQDPPRPMARATVLKPSRLKIVIPNQWYHTCPFSKGRNSTRHVVFRPRAVLREARKLSLPQEKLEMFKSMADWATDNLLVYLKPVEKCWRVSSKPYIGTKEALPTYQTTLNNHDAIQDETGSSMTSWAVWIRGWTVEENRHGNLLNKYLYLSGRVDMRQVEKTIQYLIGSGMHGYSKNSVVHAPGTYRVRVRVPVRLHTYRVRQKPVRYVCLSWVRHGYGSDRGDFDHLQFPLLRLRTVIDFDPHPHLQPSPSSATSKQIDFDPHSPSSSTLTLGFDFDAEIRSPSSSLFCPNLIFDAKIRVINTENANKY